MHKLYQKDISLVCFVEKRNNIGDWEKITGFKLEDYDPKSEWCSTERYFNAETPFSDVWVNDYILALLGHKQFCYDNKIIPIHKPKKLPYDISNDVIDSYYDDYDNGDTYGYSFLTAKEIMDYAHKDDEIEITKYIDVCNYKKFKETGIVPEYRDLPFGTYTTIVPNDFCDNGNFPYAPLTYTPITFKKKISELCSWLFGGALTQLMERSSNGEGDDVRLVFWMYDYYNDVEKHLFLK